MSVPSTPLASFSARASIPPTTATHTPAPAGPHTQQPPAAPVLPSIPPPADFDIIPDLHRLLARLQAPPSLAPAKDLKESDRPLEIQHLVGEANAIKRKLARAREKVLVLPDIERSVAEQEEEMGELEARIRNVTEKLVALGRQGSERGEQQDEDIRMAG